jgi:polyhydroxybutyrate depolymerase
MSARFFRYPSVLSGLIVLALLLTGCAAQASVLSTRALPLVSPSNASGCGKRPPFLPGMSANEELREANLERLFRLHIPSGYSSENGYPLVINFHGHGNTAAAQERMTGLSRLANQAGFIVAYPQGSIGADGRTGWNTGPSNYPHANDLRFTADVVHQIQSQLCVNTRRIYATGFSNGGGMTNVLACKMADVFAAFALVSAGIHPVSGGCHPARPVPFLEIHGTADTTVPYGGNLVNDHEPPVQQTLATWVQLDGCATRPVLTAPQANVITERWDQCRAGVSVVHYRLHGGVHAWPMPGAGPGIDGHSINATTVIWNFLRAYSLPAKIY